jgi:cation diffusion facilitator CzcD-associated flavoprotein CzcO
VALDTPLPHDVRVAIVGAGFGGIGTAARLLQAGERDFVVLERAGAVGGTWRDNSYPGCACDVQSSLYAFSFAPNPDWSRSYSPQPEIRAYLESVTDRFGVRPHVRMDCELVDATWDDAAARWRLTTTRGELSARMLVMAQGFLSDPVLPALPGLERFRGRTFHSARWDHGFDLAGKRVAVIGTGASAIQFVPAIQPAVARLHLFQRTPAWVIPRLDRALGRRERALYRRVPAVQRLVRAALEVAREGLLLAFRRPSVARLVQRLARYHMERAIADPALRARLTPSYVIGCKRVLISNDYFPALARPNVEVVTDRIVEVREHGIVAADGIERPVDAIIFGTGFRPTAPPLAAHVRGRTGRTLAESWAGSPNAYLGITVADFPNLFMLLGPNTGLGHSSVLLMIEAQIEHVLGALRHLQAHDDVPIEPRVDAQRAWLAQVDQRMRGTVWVDGGCASWYLDANGRNAALWPDTARRYRRRVAHFDPSAYMPSTYVATSSTGVASRPVALAGGDP